MALDYLVHFRLGDRRLVCLVVPASAIAHEIYHHVLLKLIAKIDGQLRYKYNGLWIISVYMENRRLHHFGNIRTVLCGTRICGLAGSETNLIIENNMQRAARSVSTGLRHLKRLHDNALSRKRGVPMNNYWHDRITDRILPPVLPSSH